MGKMSGKKASSLGGVEKTSLADQSQNQIMDVGQDPGTLPNGETGGIFFEGHIPSVMRASLDAPMSTANFQELLRHGFFTCQAGDAEFDCVRGFVTDAPTPPLEFAFQTVDLCESWPGGIGIEHLAGGDRANFDAPVSLVDFLCREEIGLDFAKAGLGILRGEEGLDVFIQSGLVFLYRKDIVSAFVADRLGQAFLGV